MGTITERKPTGKNAGKPSSWKVEAIYKGQKRYNTLATPRLAKEWMWETEDLMEKQAGCTAYKLTLYDAMKRYAKEFSPHKKSGNWEIARCKKYDPSVTGHFAIGRTLLTELTAVDGNDHMSVLRNENGLGDGSIIREFSFLKVVVRACENWYELPYPWSRLKLPAKPKGRKRLVQADEIAKMKKVAGYVDGQPIRTVRQGVIAMWLFGMETGARQNEIFKLRACDIDLANHTALLLDTKNKTNRSAVLSNEAERIIDCLPDCNPQEKLFGFCDSVSAVSTAFVKIRKKAGLHNSEDNKAHFRFHDSRHNYCTAVANMPDISTATGMEVLGHQDIRSHMIYMNNVDDSTIDRLRKNMEANRQKKRGIEAVDPLRELLDKGLSNEEAMAVLEVRKAVKT